MNEIDELVKRFRSTFDEPPNGALERARSRALAGAAQSRPERRMARWIALPAVAVAVTAAAAAATLALGPLPVAPPPVQPGGPTTPAPTTTGEVIEAWALSFEAGPPAPPSALGQTISVEMHVFQNGEWGIQDATLYREGLLPVDDPPISDQTREYYAELRAEFERTGPTFYSPTAAWLDAIDPSPANLRHAIEVGPCIDGPCPVDDRSVAIGIGNLLASAEVVLPPRVRAGLLRLLGTLPDVTVYEDTIDGHVYRVVSVPGHPHDRRGDRYARLEFYIDPIARRFAGWGAVHIAAPPDLPQCATWDPPLGQPHPTPAGAECDEATPLNTPDRFLVILVDQTLLTP